MLIRAAQAGGMGALVSGATAPQGGSITDIAQATSDGFLWGAIGGAIAGGTAVMFNQAETTGSSLAGNYAVRQAVDVGTDTVLDTVQAVARGEDVNAKTIGRDLLANTLMAGAQVAGGSRKNGIVDTGTGSKGASRNKAQYEGADLPLGSKHNQMNQPKNPSYQSHRNTLTNIGGREYSGHALDRMQDRGIMPSVVENTVEHGVPSSSYGGKTQFYDSVNNVSAILNENGKVVTVTYGK